MAFTIATIASNMSRYVDDLAVLYSIIGRNAIELTAFAIFCHNLVARPFAGIPWWLHVSGNRATFCAIHLLILQFPLQFLQ